MSDYQYFEDKMKKTCDALSSTLATIRAGRANAAVLDQISVEYYGSPTPIQQVASVSTPDPRSLYIPVNFFGVSTPQLVKISSAWW